MTYRGEFRIPFEGTNPIFAKVYQNPLKLKNFSLVKAFFFHVYPPLLGILYVLSEVNVTFVESPFFVFPIYFGKITFLLCMFMTYRQIDTLS